MSMTSLPRLKLAAPLAALVLLAGCATIPSGPSALVLPGTGKSFDQFRFDDAQCRGFASQQVGGQTPNDAAVQSGVASAAIGTAIGAAAGAAISGSSQGAAWGAGTGLLVGSTVGASNAYASSYQLQARYDFAYQQCMFAKGNRVPVDGRFANVPGYGYSPSARVVQPSGNVPPPPPGNPPAPPSVARLPPPPPPPGAPPPPPPR
jgi:Glycine-zipper domain